MLKASTEFTLFRTTRSRRGIFPCQQGYWQGRVLVRNLKHSQLVFEIAQSLPLWSSIVWFIDFSLHDEEIFVCESRGRLDICFTWRELSTRISNLPTCCQATKFYLCHLGLLEHERSQIREVIMIEEAQTRCASKIASGGAICARGLVARRTRHLDTFARLPIGSIAGCHRPIASLYLFLCHLLVLILLVFLPMS